MHQITRFKINDSQVVFETYDEEVVLVNLENGNYYSIDHVAAEIWSDIEKGLSREEIIDRIHHIYQAQENNIENAVKQFISELEANGLIHPVPSTNEKDHQENYQNHESCCSEKHPFIAPVLNCYSDMKDLLLLDPIHEVDESGWPHVKPSPSDSRS